MKTITFRKIIIPVSITLYVLVAFWIYFFKCNLVELYFLCFKPSFNAKPFTDIIQNGQISYSNVGLSILNIIGFIPLGYLFSKPFIKHHLVFSSLLCLLFTIIIEVLQYYLSFGSSQLFDIVMNFLGGFIGAILYCILKQKSLIRLRIFFYFPSLLLALSVL